MLGTKSNGYLLIKRLDETRMLDAILYVILSQGKTATQSLWLTRQTYGLRWASYSDFAFGKEPARTNHNETAFKQSSKKAADTHIPRPVRLGCVCCMSFPNASPGRHPCSLK